jgi:hypothetical protein
VPVHLDSRLEQTQRHLEPHAAESATHGLHGRSALVHGTVRGAGDLLQVREPVVVLVFVDVVDDLTGLKHFAGMAPPNQVVLVTVSPAVSLARVVRRRDNQDVRPVPHDGRLTRIERYRELLHDIHDEKKRTERDAAEEQS